MTPLKIKTGVILNGWTFVVLPNVQRQNSNKSESEYDTDKFSDVLPKMQKRNFGKRKKTKNLSH